MGNAIARTHAAIKAWRARRADLGLLILRVVVGGHLMFMTQDNVFSWGRMLEFRDFMVQFGFPFPLLCAVLSVIGQFGGGLALVAAGLCLVFTGAGRHSLDRAWRKAA